MHKFFVKNNQVEKDIVNIINEDVNHITKVLRLGEGDNIQICNIDNGINYICGIQNFCTDKVECKIIQKIISNSEANIDISIFQGLPKAEKMELIIQKCTELGVKEITPVEMERCIVKLDNKSESKKIERWQKIAEAAAKQCKRDTICKINNVINIKNICNNIKNYDIVLVPYENEKNNSFSKILKEQKDKNLKIAIVIGPEGGFEEKEIEILEKNNAKIVTLGSRILRTETVSMAMTSAIMYEYGNLG